MILHILVITRSHELHLLLATSRPPTPTKLGVRTLQCVGEQLAQTGQTHQHQRYTHNGVQHRDQFALGRVWRQVSMTCERKKNRKFDELHHPFVVVVCLRA
jgi:hypothetical protein